MSAPLRLIQSSPALPTEADAVVIGGGIVGAFATYYLAMRGLKVALVEKGVVGGEQSSRNWGWCRQQNRDARELPISTKSLDLWDRFAADSGEDAGFRRCGLFYLSNDEEELDTWARWGAFARTVGVSTRMLDGAEATERGGFTGRRWRGGVLAPTDGIADPGLAAPAAAKAAMRHGGTVHQGCAARGIELAGGAVSGIITEKGTIRTKLAIHTGGAWASSFCHQLGIRFPQASVRQSIVAVASDQIDLPDALHTKSVSITRRGDGCHTLSISGWARVDPTPQFFRFHREFLPMFLRRWRSLSPGGLEGWRSGHETGSRWTVDQPTPMERMRVLDPTPDPRTVRLTVKRAIDLVPGLRAAPVINTWAGYIDSTPDGVPVIGGVPDVPGFILAAGFSGHGFGIGPGAGHLIADLATGSTPIVDPRPYALSRFDKGKKIDVADF
ncbi:FAD dependent oxidoreductase [Nitrospirillum viridazoti Y2]|uniref:Glycine/D-amino acid oxidase-like deaminating enzyme n=1 Tax=Nitrospirillum amazonense TaxID=28077 RepID=A0A560HVH3_9PROT|nr:FAD-binding oxidoreductase [Nitrospirillum amazonense]EGY01020.1 FAD dependent oxidoreductase [Nitrospirillum amazonense Y2]TWB50632.1 glycine/D-amino acid oxidase-like deaminating enzyme [Nitrospirillum amazonense]